MGKTNIEWCDYSLNFYTWDCTKISPGCANCYMMTLANRYGKPLSGRPQWRGANAYKELRAIPPGMTVFVNDMSDTYHESVPDQWIHSIHNAAAYLRPDLTFLLLTKRPERAYYMRHLLAWPSNLWLGASVENADYLWRLHYLLRTPAAGHFLSAEPLLGALGPELRYYLGDIERFGRRGWEYRRPGLKWVIVGGESGPNRRPFDHAWAKQILDACLDYSVPFFFKQGSAFKPGQDRKLNGWEWSQTPFTASTI